ncbi:unnamed protein product [Rhizoctonia solani]|uniref:Uncharacterized protein n=1 Tax=Rhizoctonia solani TaxID=456999 RepID=A0A8H3DIV1_9AGAM|nr:unnamed protein product [Rhizoctonia solani]CAE7196513.1 unnamed protein product [Rhizoctonia solani]
MESTTVLAYIVSMDELERNARRSGQYFAGSPGGFAGFQMAFYIYREFEHLGPIQLHFIGINKVTSGDDNNGIALVLGYPDQKPEELPQQLRDVAARVFKSQPRLVTRVGRKGSNWTSPKEDGTGVDSIIMVRQDPHSSSWSRFNQPG